MRKSSTWNNLRRLLARCLGTPVRAGLLAAGLALVAGSATPSSAQAADEALEPIVVGAPAKLEVFPTSFRLDGSRRSMRLIVTGLYGDGASQDLTRASEITSANPAVAVIENGVVRPVADGATEIVIRAGGQEVKVPVEVSKSAAPEPVSFHDEALAALTKNGCNQGACHGSPSGKGGFRLSLRGYDPAVDIETLIREAYNRRTDVQTPEASLLLRKPLMEVAHGGGRRMKKSDPAYIVLRNWIAEGLKLDAADAPKMVKIQVYPTQRVLMRPAHTQQMVVLGHFSDGSIRDVTGLAVFSSSDEAVASVDENGFVVGHDRGETAILVRVLEKMETAYITFLKQIDGFQWPSPPANNYVDELVFQKLQQLQIAPSDLCSDDEFIRRVYLDVIGILPRPEETKAFLTSAEPQKRARLVDALLERPEFAEYWGLKWCDLLRVNNKLVTASGVHKYRRWIVEHVRTNTPYDQFVRELITSQGSTFDTPAANFFRTAGDTNDCTETSSQLFLGVRIQCAKCHNHPFEQWTQDNYYGIAAFFNRVQRKKAAATDEMVVYVARAGEVTQPRTGKQMKPWLPLRGEIDLPGEEDRRQALADYLSAADSPLFAKAGVNRLWGHLMGRGIVEPVDDFRASNPPSNAALLDALAKDFIDHKFDQKYIIKTILNSRIYQLSSRKNEFNKTDAKYFSHSRTRMLTAEQLLDAICEVTGVMEKFPGLPSGTKATQLPSPDVNNYFLKVFGQPPREMACQCERSTESNLSQALQMINGPLIHAKLTDANNRFRKLVTAGKTDAEIVAELYQSGLCRDPAPAEVDAAVKHVAAQPDRLKGLEDVCWAILNAKEFLFQH